MINSKQLGKPVALCHQTGCFSRPSPFALDRLPDSEEIKCDNLEEVPVPEFLKLSIADLLLETIVYYK